MRLLNTSELTEYLRNVLNLEKSIYEQKKIESELIRKMNSLGRPIAFQKPAKPKYKSGIFAGVIGGLILGWIPGTIIVAFIVESLQIKTEVWLLPVFLLICAICGGIIGSIISKHWHKDNLKEYNQKNERIPAYCFS